MTGYREVSRRENRWGKRQSRQTMYVVMGGGGEGTIENHSSALNRNDQDVICNSNGNYKLSNIHKTLLSGLSKHNAVVTLINVMGFRVAVEMNL